MKCKFDSGVFFAVYCKLTGALANVRALANSSSVVALAVALRQPSQSYFDRFKEYSLRKNWCFSPARRSPQHSSLVGDTFALSRRNLFSDTFELRNEYLENAAFLESRWQRRAKSTQFAKQNISSEIHVGRCLPKRRFGRKATGPTRIDLKMQLKFKIAGRKNRNGRLTKFTTNAFLLTKLPLFMLLAKVPSQKALSPDSRSPYRSEIL